MPEAAPPRGESDDGRAHAPPATLAFRAPLAPEGVTATRLAELTRALGDGRAVLAGVHGSAGAFAVASVAARGADRARPRASPRSSSSRTPSARPARRTISASPSRPWATRRRRSAC